MLHGSYQNFVTLLGCILPYSCLSRVWTAACHTENTGLTAQADRCMWDQLSKKTWLIWDTAFNFVLIRQPVHLTMSCAYEFLFQFQNVHCGEGSVKSWLWVSEAIILSLCFMLFSLINQTMVVLLCTYTYFPSAFHLFHPYSRLHFHNITCSIFIYVHDA